MGMRLFAALSPPSMAIEHLLGALDAVRVADDGLRTRRAASPEFFGDGARGR